MLTNANADAVKTINAECILRLLVSSALLLQDRTESPFDAFRRFHCKKRTNVAAAAAADSAICGEIFKCKAEASTRRAMRAG